MTETQQKYAQSYHPINEDDIDSTDYSDIEHIIVAKSADYDTTLIAMGYVRQIIFHCYFPRSVERNSCVL